MTAQQGFSPAMQQRIARLLKEADSLFSLGDVREHCQKALLLSHENLQPSPFSDWGVFHSSDSEYLFAWHLTMTYRSTMDETVQWAQGCMSEFLLSEAREERERRIEEFARMKIASRWYQMKDDDVAWRVFSRNIPFTIVDRQNEVNEFFELLDRISILTDILTGHASEYGLEVEYGLTRGNVSSPNPCNDNKPSESRQAIIYQLLDLADKGEWAKGMTADDIKAMLKAVLSQGEMPLTDNESGLSETLWQLLENGRGDRVKIVWQNMVGYFADRHLLPSSMGAPALNKMFFGDETGYTNIDKGRPSKGLMTADFESLVPLLDAYVPKVDKKA